MLNATNDEPVASARVIAENADTRERGIARTDANGSFAIPTRDGYHTLRGLARGYFTATDNVQVGPDGTARVVLELHPGTPTRRACCLASAPSARTVADNHHGDTASVEEVNLEGHASYEGSPGGLGPYDPAKLDTSQAADEPMPVPVPGPAIGLIAAAVAVASRRHG
jgi:hypothetical protein